MDAKQFLFERLRHFKEVRLSVELFNEAFPESPRPSAIVMESIVDASIQGLDVSGIFPPSQKEQVEEFCKALNVEMIRPIEQHGMVIIFKHKG